MEFAIQLTGTSPLIMHSARLADPSDLVSKKIKEVTDKRKMTDADLEVVASLHHFGGLYLDDEVGPYVPGENIARCLVDGAKISRAGQKVIRGVFIHSNVNALEYSGPRDANGLWADSNFRITASVRIGMKRIMRVRPIFRQWSVTASGSLDTEVLSFSELQQIASTAGKLVGLGDWRPRYGRFSAVLKEL